MTGPTSWGTKKTQSLPLASCRQPRSLQTRSLGSLVARVLRDLATDSLLEQGDSRRTLKRLMTPCLFAILSHLLFARKTFSRPAIRQKFQGFAKVNLGLWWFLWFYGFYIQLVSKVWWVRTMDYPAAADSCAHKQIHKYFYQDMNKGGRPVRMWMWHISEFLILPKGCLRSVNQETITLGTFSRTFRSLKVARGKRANVGY